MEDRTATPMDATDIATFLAGEQTGVLSLADGDDSYAIPVSFAFQPDEQAIYFRLGFAPGSQKRKFISTTDHATFVVHARTDAGWKSVVASGRIEEIPEGGLDSSIVETVKGLHIPYFKVFERPTSNLEFEIARLKIDSLNGMVEAGR